MVPPLPLLRVALGVEDLVVFVFGVLVFVVLFSFTVVVERRDGVRDVVVRLLFGFSTAARLSARACSAAFLAIATESRPHMWS